MGSNPTPSAMAFRIGKRSDFKKPAVGRTGGVLRRRSIEHVCWAETRWRDYTFDHLAKIIEDFVEQQHLDRYTLVVQDYGGPVGFRMVLAHPERVQAMIIQNAVSHEEGLSPLWAVRRAFWQDRPAHEAEVRSNLLSLEATRKRHVGTSPDARSTTPTLSDSQRSPTIGAMTIYISTKLSA
jgi:pimeloyl-ACP methyl ester carboxylesterase